MKYNNLKKSKEVDVMLKDLEGKHNFLSDIKRFPIPNEEEIDFDINEMNKYWIQKSKISNDNTKNKNDAISYIDEKIGEDTTYWYMGKMMKDREGGYSPEFVVGSLQYLFANIPSGKVSIVLAPKISELMNGSEDVKTAMTVQEQKDYIKYYTLQYFPDREKDLNIINIEDKHKDLFDLLDAQSKNPLDSLDVSSPPLLEESKISALKIAQHFYYACKQNPDLDKLMRKLTPSSIKDKESKSEASNYYGLIEISCRLADYLNGIEIQGGKSMQGKYDQFIKIVLSSDRTGQIRTELDSLVKFCNEILEYKNQKFTTIHFKTGDYKECINNQKEFDYEKAKESHKKLKKLKWISSLTTIALLSTFTYMGISKHQEQKRVEDAIEKVVSSRLNDIKTITIWFEGRPHSLNDSDSKNTCLYYIETATDYFISRYGKGEFTESEIQGMITSSLMNKDILQDLGYESWKSNQKINEFIDNQFIQQHQGELMVGGVSLKPQNKYKKYTNNFKKSIQHKKEDGATLRQNLKYTTNEISDHNVEEIGEYITMDGQKYIIGIVKGQSIASERIGRVMTHAMEDVIVAKTDYTDHIKKSETSEDRHFWQGLEKRSSKEGFNVSLDYFLQREPKIQKTIDAFVYRYAPNFPKEYFNAYRNFDESEGRNKTKQLIIEYFVKNNIEDLVSDVDEKQTEDIMKLLIDDFIPQNQDTLLKNKINIKPYNRYQGYEDIFLDTKNLDIPEELLYISNHYDYDYRVIEDGFYQTSDGINYNIGYIVYDGKKYVVADKKEKEQSYTDYSLQDGKKVALDYFKIVKQYEKAYNDLEKKKQKVSKQKKYSEQTSKYIKETLYYHKNKTPFNKNKKFRKK